MPAGFFTAGKLDFDCGNPVYINVEKQSTFVHSRGSPKAQSLLPFLNYQKGLDKRSPTKSLLLTRNLHIHSLIPMRIPLLATVGVSLLLSIEVHGQNVQNDNRGVIINVVVPTPVYQPLEPPTPPVDNGPSDFDRLMEKTTRENNARQYADEERKRAESAAYLARIHAQSEREWAVKKVAEEKARLAHDVFPSKATYYVTVKLGIMSRGSMFSEVIAVLDKGAKLKLMALHRADANGWSQVYDPSSQLFGYIPSSYLQSHARKAK